MHVYLDFRRFRTRLQDLASFRRKEKKRVVISAPFNFKREGGIPPGMSEDEILLMREKAAASRIGIADEYGGSCHSLHPLPAPPSRSSSLVMRAPESPLMINFRVSPVGSMMA